MKKIVTVRHSTEKSELAQFWIRSLVNRMLLDELEVQKEFRPRVIFKQFHNNGR